MSVIDKLRGYKEILKIEQVETEFGPGHRINVAIGSAKKFCYLIQDKATGEWKTLGDPKACQLLAQTLEQIGTPIAGSTTSEKIKEQSV